MKIFIEMSNRLFDFYAMITFLDYKKGTSPNPFNSRVYDLAWLDFFCVWLIKMI